MTPQKEILELIHKTLKEKLDLQIQLEKATDAGGIFADAAPGYTETVYYDRKSIHVFPIRFSCISPDQIYCIETLSVICEYLRNFNAYPAAETFQWINQTVATEPNNVSGKEEEKFTYSCVINFKIFY